VALGKENKCNLRSTIIDFPQLNSQVRFVEIGAEVPRDLGEF
jgi:hypothetical protein